MLTYKLSFVTLRISFASALAIVFILIAPAPTQACSCAYKEPCDAFADASAVFMGRMISGSEKVKTEDSRSYEAGTVRFAVEEVFKGKLGAEVSLSVESHINTSCGPYGLIRGERHVVYAYGEPNKLSTGICTRTSLASDADKDLQFLRNLPEEGAGGKLDGYLWVDKKTGSTVPLSSITVVITGEDEQSRKVVSNAEGMFELAGLKAGKYKVEPVWPDIYFSDKPKTEVKISDRGCTFVTLEARMRGSISGRITDVNGRPANVAVMLISANPADKDVTMREDSDDEGNFQISGVPPGRYMLQIEMVTEGWEKSQYYFYPGVKTRQEARMITLGLGQNLAGHNFQLPAEFIKQTIEGRVTWPDGSPAAAIMILLLCPKNSQPDGYMLEFGPTGTMTDSSGNFRIQGFRGMTYWIEARGAKDDISKHSLSRYIVVSEDMTNVNLVLSEAGYSGGCGETSKKK
jgi:hypothetical protein